MIKDKKTAKLIMEALEKTYEKRGMKSLVNAQKVWRELEYRNDRPLQEFFQECETLASEVKIAGGRLEEEEVVSQLLVAMPSDYDAVVSAMDILFNKEKSSISLEYVKNTLLAEYERSNKRGDESQNVFAAYKNQAFWSLMYFIGFCYLSNQWSNTTIDEDILEVEGTSGVQAAIVFSFFSVFTWAGSAWFAYQRFLQGNNAMFATGLDGGEAQMTGATAYSSYSQDDQAYQDPPFSNQHEGGGEYPAPTY